MDFFSKKSHTFFFSRKFLPSRVALSTKEGITSIQGEKHFTPMEFGRLFVTHLVTGFSPRNGQKNGGSFWGKGIIKTIAINNTLAIYQLLQDFVHQQYQPGSSDVVNSFKVYPFGSQGAKILTFLSRKTHRHTETTTRSRFQLL